MTNLLRKRALDPRQHDSLVNGSVVENHELVRVDHVNEVELLSLRLEEGKHFWVSESGNGKVEAPGQNALLLRPRDEVRNVARYELFIEITPHHRREFVQHFLQDRAGWGDESIRIYRLRNNQPVSAQPQVEKRV